MNVINSFVSGSRYKDDLLTSSTSGSNAPSPATSSANRQVAQPLVLSVPMPRFVSRAPSPPLPNPSLRSALPSRQGSAPDVLAPRDALHASSLPAANVMAAYYRQPALRVSHILRSKLRDPNRILLSLTKCFAKHNRKPGCKFWCHCRSASHQQNSRHCRSRCHSQPELL